jgi:predicted RNA-binding Zn-ribbon protein involved in translation (DUF1610 family)
VSTEAPVLPCRGCGAPLAVDPETADASCGACRTVTPVPDALRERARAYRRSIGAERGRVERARRSSKDAFAKMGLYFGPPLALVIIGHIVATMVIDPSYQQEEMFAFYGGLGLVGVVYFAWLVVTVRADNREDDPTPAMLAAAATTPIFEGSIAGTCSSCGGEVTFVIEQANARCPYCGATVFPTPAAQQALLALAAEKSDLEVGRASRAHLRSLAMTFDGGVLEGAMSSLRWVGWLTMPVVLVVGGVALTLRAGLPDFTALDALDIVGLVLTGGGVLLVAAVVGIAWLVRRLSRLHAIRRTLQAIATSAGARVAPGVKPVFDWLDAHWAAAVPDEVLSVASSDDGDKVRRFSVAMTFAGRPALLAVAHAPHWRRTDLFFALHGRRDPARGQSTRATAEARNAGYAVMVSNGGAHLIMLDSDPRAFAPATVTWLLERAAQVAQA